MKLDKFLRLFEHMGIFVRDQGLTVIWVSSISVLGFG